MKETFFVETEQRGSRLFAGISLAILMLFLSGMTYGLTAGNFGNQIFSGTTYDIQSFTTAEQDNASDPLLLNLSDRDVRNMTIRERIFFGGFLGMQFGTFTAISLNLHAGFLVTNNFSVGAGGIYQYTNDNLLGTSYSSHVYGANAFARFNVYSGFFLHTEYERLRLKTRLSPFNQVMDPDERATVSENNYFLGAGYGLRMSERLTINLLLLYNLNENSHVYFDNPFFRFGVDIFM